MSEVAVRVDDVNVHYRVRGRGPKHLRTSVAGNESQGRDRVVRAVRGVSFEAQTGETVGIIGRNGSGKSTLLRAIAGLIPTASGEVLAIGQPVLLGVGAALKGDVSGRQNVVLGAAALGLRRSDILARMDDIVEFAGLEEFIDMPFRTYSSGMKARLQFAVATSVQPKILMVDEALAVGDEEFKARSQERIQELTQNASTVFLVSHSLSTIKRRCDRALWLERGEKIKFGSADDVVTAYREDMVARREARAARAAEEQEKVRS